MNFREWVFSVDMIAVTLADNCVGLVEDQNNNMLFKFYLWKNKLKQYLLFYSVYTKIK